MRLNRLAFGMAVLATALLPGARPAVGQTFMARQPGYWLALVFGLIGVASLLTRGVLRRMTV